ncbi:MAG: FAD binding domain-containing protein [Myxococcales bacterium]|nr:FAD binding domain-containing protein [Myxococcales bacterium]
MLLPAFSYERPAELPGALALLQRLAAAGVSYRVHAGGTDLVPELKRDEAAIGTVVSISRLEALRGVRARPDGGLEVGALTRLSALAEEVRERFPVISDTALQIASPQIRNRATLGGNLLVDNRCVYFNQSPDHRDVHAGCFKAGGEVCHLVPSAKRGAQPLCRARFVSDLAPVLILHDAKVVLARAGAERELLLKDLYAPDGIQRTQVAPGELLTRVLIPASATRRVHYLKLRIRQALDFPSLGVAVSLDGKKLGVALTGVNTHPVVLAYEGALDATLKQACEDGPKRVAPLAQDFFSPAYRRQMIPVLIRRAVAVLSKKDTP